MTEYEEVEWNTERQERFWTALGWERFDCPDDETWYFKPAPNYNECLEIQGSRWISPDGTCAVSELPDIHDLNALFRWGVLKVIKEHTIEFTIMETHSRAVIYDDFGDSGLIIVTNQDPALALAEAIEKVLANNPEEV